MQIQNTGLQPFREQITKYTKQHSNNSMFDPLKHQQGVWSRPGLQRYFPLHMTNNNYNPTADEQISSIREDTIKTIQRRTGTQATQTFQQQHRILEDSNKYNTLDTKDVKKQHNTTTPRNY